MVRLPGVSEVLGMLQAQTEALTSLPSTLASLNRTVRKLERTLEASRETFDAVQRVAGRLEDLLDELEEPVRGLAPGLKRVATVLDDPIVDQIPDTVAQLRETQAKVATIAATTERIMAFADETTARLQSLPGAGLLRWPRRELPPEI